MKALKTLAVALIVGTFSLSALAATEITREQAKENKYQLIGEVSTSGEAKTSDTAIKQLSKLADEKGGTYFVVIAMNEKGKVFASAEVYK
ncbi:DUF1471 domain-containing protein [Budvicia diplopodorum]|uniref:DUF1471 domain-containing protein n=1 Tax=Budvicia diplopodorum TaxID=1119056 RepID=UPI0013568366|nr:DUF1471 domain-containing protein [Budvicia diplopodorum]